MGHELMGRKIIGIERVKKSNRMEYLESNLRIILYSVNKELRKLKSNINYLSEIYKQTLLAKTRIK
jgi:hypothetical protein